MAINKALFTEKIDVGLKATKDFKTFFLRFNINRIEYSKILDYSGKDWDKRTTVSKARVDAENFKESKKNQETEFDEKIKLNNYMKHFFEKKEVSTSYSGDKWKNQTKSFYNKYIEKDIGDKKIIDIRKSDIDKIIIKLNKLNLSKRTQKATLEILNPVFKDAISNRIILYNPCSGIVINRPKTKKKVNDASKILKEAYVAIITIFKDDLYFQALYLFALQGRRKSEIITLKWENIDFERKEYTLPETKNGEEQTFTLPDNIAKLLLRFETNKMLYVFESPTNPQDHIKNIQAQTNKLKKALNNPSFGIHYLRNVVTSAMAQQGINSTYLSGALGHSDINTINKYVSIPYIEGSKIANEAINRITNNE